MRVGILHPGAMGASFGTALAGCGHEVVWASESRSQATRARADLAGMVDLGSVRALAARCELVISVCPPGHAAEVARQVSREGFTGTYLDANAVAPATARDIAAVVGEGGAAFIDGGIIGPPAHHAGLTVLYLSGDAARCDAVAEAFAGSVVGTRYVNADPGAASTVKMAFAAWTKGTSALLLAVRALAERAGVVDTLEHAWSTLTPELAERVSTAARSTAPKAWRFGDEMREIAATFDAAGLPPGFHEAAAEIYDALATFRDRTDVGLDEVMASLGDDPRV